MSSANKQLLATAVLAIAVSPLAQAGSIFITGHDSDEHNNGDYMSAGLDYLAFGTAATSQAERNPYSVAILNNGSYDVSGTLNSYGWNASYFDVTTAGWESSVFGTDGSGANLFDFVFTGSGGATDLHNALIANTSNFTSFFNNDGGIYINTDEGFGQAWYDFVPSFGTTQNNTIFQAGAFTPTQAGIDIGLTDEVVDRDITHSYYTGVNTSLFTVFETFDGTGDPVAIGLREGTIGDGGFQGGDPTQVPEPASIFLIGAGLLGLAVSRRRKPY